MKVVIAGSRDFNDYDFLCEVIKLSKFLISEVVSGGAKGVDSLGERWAKENNVPVKIFPADWDAYGRSAGPMRNYEMSKYADALIAVNINQSPGTSNMINYAKKRGLPSFIVEINTGDDD